MSERQPSAQAFVDRVEAELDCEVDLAEELGEDLGWFCIEVVLVCEGEEFVADVDFNLSEAGVEVLYAEITVDMDATGRRAILNAIGERLIGAEGEETYRYEPSEEELASLLDELREIHADVFG
ncbi:MAG: hypothetical protein ABEH56_00005 [Salinirussus sp.]